MIRFVFIVALFLGLAVALADPIAQGDALEANGQHKEALEIFLAADAAEPGNAEVLHRISKQYGLLMDETSSQSEKERLGRLGLQYAEKAVEADPRNADAHLSVAICIGKISFLKSPRERIKDSERIRSAAQRAVDLDPRNDLAWHVLGRWHYELANLDGGTRFFAETFFGKLPDASNAKAVEYLERARQLDPGRLINRVELGRAYLAAGQNDEARRELQAAIAMSPASRADREALERARKALARLE